jgi:hypothetical protein
MRGRRNLGVTQARWAATRKRFLRRAHRYYISGRKRQQPGHTVPAPPGRKPHWVMIGGGHSQHHLRTLIRKQAAWARYPYHGTNVITHGGGGGRVPPWWRAVPPLRDSGPGRTKPPNAGVIGKQRRLVKVRGHKEGRLRGEPWKAAAAFRYWCAVHQAGWPAWDPEHRMPVFP